MTRRIEPDGSRMRQVLVYSFTCSLYSVRNYCSEQFWCAREELLRVVRQEGRSACAATRAATGACAAATATPASPLSATSRCEQYSYTHTGTVCLQVASY